METTKLNIGEELSHHNSNYHQMSHSIHQISAELSIASSLALSCEINDQDKINVTFLLQSTIKLELTYTAPVLSGKRREGDVDQDEDEVEGKGDIDKEEEKGGCVCPICCHGRC